MNTDVIKMKTSKTPQTYFMRVCGVSSCVTDKNKPPAMQVEGRSLDIRKLPCIINVGLQTTNKDTGGVPNEHRK